MRALVIATLVSMAAPAAAKPGAIAIPPMEIELGAGTPLGETAPAAASTELRVGGSWASLYWKPTPVDFTIGYVGSYRSLSVVETWFHLHGLYFEAGYAIENHRHWRTWLSGRVETLMGDYGDRSLNVVGGAVRLGTELYSATAGAAGDGNAIGVLSGAIAIGVYVEGTARTLPAELGPMGVGAGVSMRLPFIAAIGG